MIINHLGEHRVELPVGMFRCCCPSGAETLTRREWQDSTKHADRKFYAVFAEMVYYHFDVEIAVDFYGTAFGYRLMNMGWDHQFDKRKNLVEKVAVFYNPTPKETYQANWIIAVRGNNGDWEDLKMLFCSLTLDCGTATPDAALRVRAKQAKWILDRVDKVVKENRKIGQEVSIASRLSKARSKTVMWHYMYRNGEGRDRR
jgi:hypothetical protein